MKIEKVEKVMKGKKIASDSLKCIIDGQECWVPEDINNRHYAEIKKLENAGMLKIQEVDLDLPV